MLDKVKNYAQNYYCSEYTTDLNQIALGFVLGLLFGGFSSGLIWFIIYVILFEIYIYYITRELDTEWKLLSRIGINCATLIGWILGRWLVLNKTGFEFTQRK